MECGFADACSCEGGVVGWGGGVVETVHVRDGWGGEGVVVVDFADGAQGRLAVVVGFAKDDARVNALPVHAGLASPAIFRSLALQAGGAHVVAWIVGVNVAGLLSFAAVVVEALETHSHAFAANTQLTLQAILVDIACSQVEAGVETGIRGVDRAPLARSAIVIDQAFDTRLADAAAPDAHLALLALRIFGASSFPNAHIEAGIVLVGVADLPGGAVSVNHAQHIGSSYTLPIGADHARPAVRAVAARGERLDRCKQKTNSRYDEETAHICTSENWLSAISVQLSATANLEAAVFLTADR